MMAKQQFTVDFTESMVAQSIREYAGGMIDPETHDIEIVGRVQGVTIRATKRRARKAKAPKVAAVKAAA
jgi:hypothetical protein